MKKMVYLVIVLMFVNLFLAAAPDGDNQKETDYNNRAQVNSLPPNELASAIAQGKITDMTLVNSDKLAAAIGSNPSIASKLETKHLTRAVNQQTSLISNDNIFSEINSRARSDVFILNDNPNIKKEWFKHFGITDNGAKIDSYNGIVVKTSGVHSTEFYIINHPGATVTDSGALKLASGAGIYNGKVTTLADGTISTNGHLAILPTVKSGKFNVEPGGELSAGRMYSSSKTFSVNIDQDKRTISGKDVTEWKWDETGTQESASFSGTVTNYPDGHKDLHKGTNYNDKTSYAKNSFSVDGMTEFYGTDAIQSGASCKGDTSCIMNSALPYGYGAVQVWTKNGNNIKIDSQSPSGVFVHQIDDSSTVTYSEFGMDRLKFSNKGMTAQGDISNMLSDDIQTEVLGADNIVHTQKLVNKQITQCSYCKDCGGIFTQTQEMMRNLGEWEEMDNLKEWIDNDNQYTATKSAISALLEKSARGPGYESEPISLNVNNPGFKIRTVVDSDIKTPFSPSDNAKNELRGLILDTPGVSLYLANEVTSASSHYRIDVKEDGTIKFWQQYAVVNTEDMSNRIREGQDVNIWQAVAKEKGGSAAIPLKDPILVHESKLPAYEESSRVMWQAEIQKAYVQFAGKARLIPKLNAEAILKCIGETCPGQK